MHGLVLFFLLALQNLYLFGLVLNGLLLILHLAYLQPFSLFNLILCFQDTIHLLLPVRTIRFEIFNSLECIIKICGRKNKIEKIISASVLIGIDHTAGILGF